MFAVIAVYAYRKKSKSNKTTSTNPHFEWVIVPEKRELKTIHTTEKQLKWNPSTGKDEYVDVPVTKTEWVVVEPAHKEYVYKED